MADDAANSGAGFPRPTDFAKTAHMNAATATNRHTDKAVSDPDSYWAKEAERSGWITFPKKIKNTSFTGDVSIKWFEDGVLNASVSCLDRHLAERGDDNTQSSGKATILTPAAT